MAHHVRYFQHCLNLLPHQYVSADASRMTFVLFCIGALDLLDTPTKPEAVEWIYNQQKQSPNAGFRAGPGLEKAYDVAHLTMTYTALQALLILGDDLSRVDKHGIVKWIKSLQTPEGSFCPTSGEEADMRFLYCACAISYMLQDWSGIDVDLALSFIRNSRTYEGGHGQAPGLEAHGGTTYCAIASLALMNKLEILTEAEKNETIGWCLSLQDGGFHGRANKDDDTCYSFWVGATLDVRLNSYVLISVRFLARWTWLTRTQTWHFSKRPRQSMEDLARKQAMHQICFTHTWVLLLIACCTSQDIVRCMPH